jgi:hypothetical protein
MDKALEGTETSNYELEFETKSKEIRYLLVNATTRRDAEYNITGVVGVVSIYQSFFSLLRCFIFSLLTCLHHLGARRDRVNAK